METDVNKASEEQSSKSQEVQKRNLRKKESTENKKDNLASDLGLLVERCDQVWTKIFLVFSSMSSNQSSDDDLQSVQTEPYRSREDMKTIMHLREQLEHEMRRSNELKIKHNAILAAEVQKVIIIIPSSLKFPSKKAKRKSWCNICSKEARYHCCASFFYCGTVSRFLL